MVHKPRTLFSQTLEKKAQLESLAAAVVGDMSVSHKLAFLLSSNKKIDRRHQSENEVQGLGSSSSQLRVEEDDDDDDDSEEGKCYY